jgi:hypothetical protein
MTNQISNIKDYSRVNTIDMEQQVLVKMARLQPTWQGMKLRAWIAWH